METDIPSTGLFGFVITEDKSGVCKLQAGDVGIMNAIKAQMRGLVKVLGTGNVAIDNEARVVLAGSALWPDKLKEIIPVDLRSSYMAAPQGIVEKIVGDYAAGM